MAVWINPNRPEPRSTYNDWSGLELAYHVFDVEKAQVSVGGLHIAKKKKEILSSSVIPTPTRSPNICLERPPILRSFRRYHGMSPKRSQWTD